MLLAAIGPNPFRSRDCQRLSPLSRFASKPLPGNGQRLRHAQVPRCYRRPWGQCGHTAPQERQAVEARHRSRMVKDKVVYVALGVSRNGVREVLGL